MSSKWLLVILSHVSMIIYLSFIVGHSIPPFLDVAGEEDLV